MTHVELVRQHKALKAAMDRARDLQQDPELLGHWGRYLCVLTAGFLENTIRVLYAEHARQRASTEVSSFVSSQLERVLNPKANKFLEVASAFKRDWAKNLQIFFDEDDGRRKNAIDSVMANRHLIAHGRSSSISVVRIREYLGAIEEVVDYIEQQLT